MNFAYTILYVPDVKQALEFYERAFDMGIRFISDEGGYGELETLHTTLAFLDERVAEDHHFGNVRLNRLSEQAPGFEIAFTTNNVEEAVDRAVLAGATLTKPATPMPWGQTIAYIRDPNGIVIEICTPMD